MDQANGYYIIKNTKTGKVLDTIDSSHGASVVVKDQTGQGNQLWKLQCFKDTVESPDVCESMPTDKFCHIVAKHSQMALNVKDSSTSSGANVVQYWETGATNDNWRFEPSSGGAYKVIAEHSGLGLYSEGHSKGASVTQSDDGDDWCFINQGGDYFEVKNKKNDLTLDVYKLGHDAGEDVIMWEYGDGQANRLFRLNCVSDADVVDTQPPPPSDGCGRLDKCYLVNMRTDEKTALSGYTSYSIDSSARYTILCDIDGNMDQVDFYYDGKRHSEWKPPFYAHYNSPDWIEPVKYLASCGTKEVRVTGKTWRQGKCFEETLNLEANCN